MKGNQHQLDGGGEATPTAKGQDVAICEECRQMPSKYKCPGCSIRTCSLPCVNSHKHRTGCPGKRDRSKFLPLSCFNDSVLLSDYNMLEEVKRVAESSQRTRAKLCPYSPYRLPLFLRGLRSAAASRKTKLLFLSNGMSKRVRNQTRYDHRKRLISWTIEWQFPSVDVVLYDHGIPEDANLRSVIKSHLQLGPWNHHLRRFCDVQLDQLKFFIRKHHKGPNSPFRELDIDAPIRQQLADLVILEYPVIHVFLPTDSYDFEILKDIHPIPQNRDAQDTCMNDSLHMNGACFPEEEIEDGHVESHTVDLMKHQNGQEVELDFDQGLIDAYSDLIALINPDEFLDLDCVYAGKEVSSVGNEVEEGEILE
ncbi:hypothetical protein SAY86_000370 [Trapa natans]|uniref:Box C/D snoRNA protein 1 n=1 Tax=Trapa natans TaxID=22666 RepID=A0AAN7MBY2_TRANT|nr:hypothetical protein SAY86_000370 [Trapa natans]